MDHGDQPMSAAPSPLGPGRGEGADPRAGAVAGESAGDTLADRVLGRVRALARRRLAWMEHLHAGTPGPVAGVVRAADIELALDGRDAPAAELAWRDRNARLGDVARDLEAYERARAADETSPLVQLCRTFELSAAERDAVEICWAGVLDPGLAKVWAYLHGHPSQNHPSETLVGRLCGDGTALSRAGALFRWEIVRPGEVGPGDPVPLVLDPHVVDYLGGRMTIDPLLAGRAAMVTPLEPLPSWPVEEVAARVRRALGEGLGARIAVVGPRHSGRRTFAACVTAALGAPALAIDTSGLAPSEWPTLHLHAQRQALLLGSSLIWFGELAGERIPSAPGLARLEIVIADADLAPEAMAGVVDDRVVLPGLSLDERRAAWLRLLPVARAWPERDFADLVARHRVQIGDIAAISLRGIDGIEPARAECRKLTRHRLGDLGRLVDCPFRREDLMLAPNLNQLLDALLYEARERATFWESQAARRLFPRGRGLVALMTGPPGTGKTMTAQIIAAELGLDLVRIDLASTVNKYIGETAKNLRRIFTRAAEMNAVLLFDEADALFAKRTDVRDAHDRYANADTNYLLQHLEEFDGIALLASNRKQNIDNAFVRRIRFVMDFPRPQPAERLLIWRRLVSELAGAERAAELGNLLGALAETLDLSGAQIKLALLAAIFAARQAGQPLALAHFLGGIERELGKEGRGIEANDRERIARHG
jgi:hypothetical protein